MRYCFCWEKGRIRKGSGSNAWHFGIEDKVQVSGQSEEDGGLLSGDGFLRAAVFFEGLPGVLVEAQAAGLKCLVSDTVTREAQATELVTWLAIEQPAAVWAERIQAEAAYERQDTSGDHAGGRF